MIDYQELLALATKAAREAGLMLLERYDELRGLVNAEEAKDIKLQADKDAEALIVQILEGSGISILAEESGMLGEAGELLWVVDPLDGTFNYSKGISICGVSIALCQQDRPLLGVFYDFFGDVLYQGGKQMGSFVNGEKVQVSSIEEIDRAVLMTGFPVGRSYDTDSLNQFVKLVQSFKKVRMIGSAASSLVWVASGKADCYLEEDISWWDVAAGAALVEGAGGEIKIEKKLENDHRVTFLAHNGKLNV